ncbi:PITP-less RdgB-like protein isoform X3 [Denticeps clupeoides]|uniref:PITP-less RdgB-like protein isoform X3 n=1 Tax=Denticeps clupeoides TaxID=299321 RepID=UPI0010A52A93|nr:membrane-associated phosphatidylinositol transfer protein 3-like isoform X3 [Denticeps clupeoides]
MCVYIKYRSDPPLCRRTCAAASSSTQRARLNGYKKVTSGQKREKRRRNPRGCERADPASLPSDSVAGEAVGSAAGSPMARESRAAALPRKNSACRWHLQNIAQESVDSSDEEFFDARAEVLEGKTAMLLGMSQWNSNDLVEQMQTLGALDRSQESLYRLRHPRCAPQSSVDGLEDVERKCRMRLLILVVHGGHILDSGGGDAGSKAGDAATLASVLDRLAHAHFQEAADGLVVRLVPCPPVCTEAFSLLTHLNPYSYDESSMSSSVDHLPLAALPLLAITSPRYLEAVATVITQANQVYHSFLQSPEGLGFCGQVCLVADCVGGVLCFDALCFSSDQRLSGPWVSSRNNSTESLKERQQAAPGSLSPNLLGSKRLSKSNIDVSSPSEGPSTPRHPLIRKQSDSCNADISSRVLNYAMDNLESPVHPLCRSLDGLRKPEDSEETHTNTERACKHCTQKIKCWRRDSKHHWIRNLLQGDLGGCRIALHPGSFDFEVSDCFLLGCPLGLVLAMRKTVLPALQVPQLHPACAQLFNLFYPSDPSASRLEPLLHPAFNELPPFAVPRYQRYPLGDGRSNLIAETLLKHPAIELGTDIPAGGNGSGTIPNRVSQPGINSQTPGTSHQPTASFTDVCSQWWGHKRLDYVLFCPDVLTTFPTVALPHLFHASYWESTDTVAFILRQVMRCDCLKAAEADCCDAAPICPSSPREKWLRRRTHVKLRNVTANHRVHDVIATEDGPQTLVGRFMYGPLDMVTLTGEKVDVFLMNQPASGRWVLYDTEATSSSGRVSYTVPANKRLPVGVYPIKMVVKGDQTSAEAFLTVLPRGMECVVFSIDGSFAASVSLMGSDPKVRAGAVDVVRHWQDLGFLIIYITGRPDMQKQRVVSWLSQHNFPQGMVFFSEGLVHDPLRQKTIFLRSLVKECHIKISAAYGSMKDMSVYSTLGLSPSQIYIVGRPSKKHQSQCQFLSEGYAAHLSSLEFEHGSRSKKGRMVSRQGSFGLSAKPDFLSPSPDFLSCKRTPLLRRAMSVQQPSPPSSTSPTPKPERAKSQPEHGQPEPTMAIPELELCRGTPP